MHKFLRPRGSHAAGLLGARGSQVYLWKTAPSASFSSREKRGASSKDAIAKTSPETFARAKRGSFFQDEPQLCNVFVEDSFLRHYLRKVMPSQVAEDVFRDLERFGARVAAEIDELGRQAELQPPVLRPYSGWGNRVDDLMTSAAWRRLHDISAEEGLVATAFERKHGEWSRLHQMAKNYLFSASSGLYSCPLAMTDGAAHIIELAGEEAPASLRSAFSHLTSRDPAHFWTSGQWMTERKGGSDVGQATDTVATRQADGSFRLYGYKWFTSATDADVALTLARIQDTQGEVSPGSPGLSLFYLHTRSGDGGYNGLELHRLKDKLGTRQLPTAELLLDGASAMLVGEEGRGVAGISPMLSITRLHNSVSAASCMRKILLLSRDYCTKRTAFGKHLADFPLHMQTLSRLEVETRGSTLLTMEIARLLGLVETHQNTSTDSLLLRILTPLAKLFTAKKAVAVISEGLESFGGAGYLEDTGLPVLLRDAQVLPIWEGTTNVVSLDVLRVLQKAGAKEVLGVLQDTLRSHLSSHALSRLGLTDEADLIHRQMQLVVTFALQAPQEDPQCLETAARDFATSLAQIYTGMLLLELACSHGAGPNDRITAQRWCSKPLPLGSVSDYSHNHGTADLILVMEGHGLSHTLTDSTIDSMGSGFV